MKNNPALSYFILTTAVVYSFAHPFYGELVVLLEERGKFQNSLQKVTDIENKKSELLNKFNSMSEEDKKKLETILPDSVDFVKLASDIDSLGAKYGISIDKVTSREISSSGGNSISEAGLQMPYRSDTIAFSFSSSYNSFLNFMDELEKSLRIMDIRTLRITQEEGLVYNYGVEFETYSIKKE